jgi:hypothetical protein
MIGMKLQGLVEGLRFTGSLINGLSFSSLPFHAKTHHL